MSVGGIPDITEDHCEVICHLALGEFLKRSLPKRLPGFTCVASKLSAVGCDQEQAFDERV